METKHVKINRPVDSPGSMLAIPDPIRVGDSIVFDCDEGPVEITFTETVFSHTWRTGDKPMTVVKSGAFSAKCSVTTPSGKLLYGLSSKTED